MSYALAYVMIGVAVVTVLFLRAHHSRADVEQDLVEHLRGRAPHASWAGVVLEKILVPVLGSAVLTLLWPATLVLYRWSRRNAVTASSLRGSLGSTGLPKRPQFSVRPEDLLERLSLSEIEARERVMDPLNAVPDVPFGHLHDAWTQFLQEYPDTKEFCSFSACWTKGWGPDELRAGYVILIEQAPGPYFMTTRRSLASVPGTFPHA